MGQVVSIACMSVTVPPAVSGSPCNGVEYRAVRVLWTSASGRPLVRGSSVSANQCNSPIVANNTADTMLRVDEGVRQMWSVPTLMCRSEGALRGIFILPREYEATRG